MRLFASKSFLFLNGEEEASIKNQDMKDMPDWIAETKLYKLAETDGSIQVIENSSQQNAIEKGNGNQGKKKNSPTENQIEPDEESPDNK